MTLPAQRPTPQDAPLAPGFSTLRVGLLPTLPALLLCLLLTFTFTLMLAGCGAPQVQSSSEQGGGPFVVAAPIATGAADTQQPPTAIPPAPTAPLPPAPTLTALAALTIIPVPPDIAGLQATHVARATTSPFPTAEPSSVQSGTPALATTRRGGISIELRLAGDTYLAGENGRAYVTVRNDSSAMLFAGGIEFVVYDDAHHVVDPWPEAVMPGPRGGWPGQYRFGGMLRPLEPGATISNTFTFQLPAVGEHLKRPFTAIAKAQFSRPNIQHPDQSDNVPASIETGAIPLKVNEPASQQRLKAEWQANRQGYTLYVTDANGQPAAGPVWGALDVNSGRGSMSGPLQDSASGTWSSGWEQYLTEDGGPLNVRAWVAARGYVPAVIQETIPGTGKAVTPGIYTPVPPVSTVAPTLTAVTSNE